MACSLVKPNLMSCNFHNFNTAQIILSLHTSALTLHFCAVLRPYFRPWVGHDTATEQFFSKTQGEASSVL